MARVYCYLTGDWKKARRAIYGLPRRLTRVVDAGFEQEADAAVRRIKNNIYAQNYPHAPLDEDTRERKEKEGKDLRILIEDGTYVRSIRAMRLRKHVWGIGVDDDDLAEIGGTHEFGSEKVPARPHYRVELERIRSGRLRTVREGMQRVLEGRDFG